MELQKQIIKPTLCEKLAEYKSRLEAAVTEANKTQVIIAEANQNLANSITLIKQFEGAIAALTEFAVE